MNRSPSDYMSGEGRIQDQKDDDGQSPEGDGQFEEPDSDFQEEKGRRR